MKLRKIMALALAAVMTASLAVGCSDDQQGGEEKQVLKVAAFKGGNGEEFLQKIAEAFEAEKGCTVELEVSSEISTDLTKDIQNGEFPDVVYYNLGQPDGFTETMLKENAIADISDVFTDELKAKLIDGITENGSAQPYGDGKTYLAPIIYTPTGFWYNEDLFGEGGYTLPTTWDEFFALGDQAKADGIALFTYPTVGYFDCTMYQMLAQSGGLDYFSKALNYDANTWTSEEGRQVLDTIAKLVSADYFQVDTVANANGGKFQVNQQNVIDGKALFMPNGNWVIGEMANSTPEGFNWGMMAQPSFDGSQQCMYTYTEQMWVPAEAPNLELAKEFIAFMYSDKVVDIMLANTTTNAETGEVSAAPIVPPVKGAYEALEDGPIKDSFVLSADCIAVAGSWATTQPIEGFAMADVAYNPIESISSGDLTVDEWQAQLVDAWAKCLENK